MRKFPFLLMAVALALAAGFAAMHAADRNPITAARHAFRHVHGVLGRTSEGELGERQDAHTLLPQDSRARIDRGIQDEVTAPSVDEPSPSGLYDGIPDYKMMPDVRGIRLGMPLQEAQAVLQRQFSNARLYAHPLPGMRILTPPPTIAIGVNTEDGWTASSSDPRDIMVVDVTAPPNAQVVWGVNRRMFHRPTDRETFLAALREKYGQETFAFDHALNLVTDSRSIKEIWWLLNEHGQSAPIPPAVRAAVKDGCGWSNGTGNHWGNPQRLLNLVAGTKGRTYDNLSQWCLSSGVAVHVTFLTMRSGKVTTTSTHMYDIPLAHRSDRITAAWWRDTVRKLEEQAIEKSKRARPTL